MTTRVRTIHRPDEEPTTVRRVTTEDATGEQHEYDFAITDDGHEPVGDGDPSEAAREALAEWEEDHDFHE